MEEIKIKNREFFKKKEHLSDFECWALKEFANRFGYATSGEWWWNDCCLYVGDGTCLWLTENGNVMLQIVTEESDDLYVLRLE